MQTTKLIESVALCIWIELVVGSCSCSEDFSVVSPVFLPSQRPTIQNNNYRISLRKDTVEVLLRNPMYSINRSVASSFVDSSVHEFICFI